MHSIRRFSLRPLQDVTDLPRRLSEALLGPYDTLPSSSSPPSASGRSGTPRQLSLALLAPLLSREPSRASRSPSPSPLRTSAYEQPLVEGDNRTDLSPDGFPSPSRSTGVHERSGEDDDGAQPSSSEKPDPFDRVFQSADDDKHRVRQRSTRAQAAGSASRRRRNYIVLLFVCAFGVTALATFHLAQREESTLGEDSSSISSGSWWPLPSSNSSWLSWSSSQNTAALLADEQPGSFEERNLYRKFDPPAFFNLSGPGGLDRFQDVEILNDECLESWIAQGKPCPSEMIQSSSPPKMELDVVSTWVNGTDPLWEIEHDEWLNKTEVFPLAPPARHYRSSKDELRHSVRSVMTYLSPPPARVHLVFGDWADRTNTSHRRGQMPGWLDWNPLPDFTADTHDTGLPLPALSAPESAREAGNMTKLLTHHHSELFLSPLARTPEEQKAFLDDATPTFNSFAIEGMLHNIGAHGGGMAPAVAYLNDDFFMLKKHTTADFISPLYGATLRLGPSSSYRVPSYETPAVGCEHEWSSLLRSNWLLSRRFGFRSRRYLEHVAKTLSTPMLLEAHAIWPAQFASAAKRRFRETSTGKYGDLNTSWLSSFLLIERARESMLWTWAVARLGGEDGTWGAAERDEVRGLLGLRALGGNAEEVQAAVKDEPKKVLVECARRVTVGKKTVDAAFQELRAEGPEATAYRWSSLDGVLPGADGARAPCELDLNVCFGPWWAAADGQATVGAAEMFTKLTFMHEGACGDCLLAAIVRKSGRSGLSALLPPSGSSFLIPSASLPAQSEGAAHDLQPHMPLTPEWTQTSFALADVLARTNPSRPEEPVDLRRWALRLIARYQFVEAKTHSVFAMVTGPTNFGELVERLTTDTSVVSLGLNDDIEERWTAVLEPLVKTFLDTRFAIRGWWERRLL